MSVTTQGLPISPFTDRTSLSEKHLLINRFVLKLRGVYEGLATTILYTAMYSLLSSQAVSTSGFAKQEETWEQVDYRHSPFKTLSA